MFSVSKKGKYDFIYFIFPIETWLGFFGRELDKNLFACEVKSDTDTEPLKPGECTMETSLIPKDKLSKVKTHESLVALGDKTEIVAGMTKRTTGKNELLKAVI